MKIPNQRLRHEREIRGWSQQKLAREIGTSEERISRWEAGATPGKQFQEKLCQLFGKDAVELGFLKQDLENTTLTAIPQSSHSPIKDSSTLFSSEITQGIMEILAFYGGAIMDENKRAFLQTIVGLTAAALHPPIWETNRKGIPAEEFLSQSAVSVQIAWHLVQGKEIAAADTLISSYMSSLLTLAVEPSQYQQEAATTATQALFLKTMLSKHRHPFNYIAREMYVHEAVQCSRLSDTTRLHALALTCLGYTCLSCPPLRPEKAIETFQEALTYLAEEKVSVIRSDIYMGLAEAYSYIRDTKAGEQAIGMAQQSYPDHPEQDPLYLYADCPPSLLYQWEGKMYLNLGDYKKAEQALKKSETYQPNMRGASQNLLYHAHISLEKGDQEAFTSFLEEGALLARSLGSQHRYQEAYKLYQQATKWKHEKRVKALAPLFGTISIC